ncbi:LysE family translocator [Magnetovibrio blakemorei]|uniref:Lysine transporter LysE n=1 Tax=Magnetovibrio blakemorei TaxID=28181 RepID=A0A1E5Q3L9_9PROT|nr:LysE family translocator [Magnetovibrio blakemorei]OEJ64382.1 lysine transporter LysE [Magnetovibrio blakemorei]
MTTTFLLTSLIVVIMPGTGVLYTLSQGISGGKRAALAATLGCTLGILPHMMASIFGLAALLHTSALAFQTVKFAGVAYLFYLAWTTLRCAHEPLDVQSGAQNKNPGGFGKIALRGLLINILNPKLSVFFLAFLPQFVPASDSQPALSLLTLSAVFMAITALVFALYGLLAAFVRDQIRNRPGVITGLRRIFAGAFGALGLRLAFAEP